VALHVALARPQAVRRLVLISATAGIDDGEARRARRRRDDELADELARSPDVGPFLARWLAAPMFDGLPADAAGLAERRRNTPSGLASSLRHAGTGTQDPLWDRLGELTLPVLLVAGSTDIRFVAAAVRMRARLPHAVVSVIPGAGHAVHLHQPALTARTVVSWLGVTGD
jgi:2-succinyl-6-hydroxy-2,4-cyclohexadiene-1-carboxylate synthase